MKHNWTVLTLSDTLQTQTRAVRAHLCCLCTAVFYYISLVLKPTVNTKAHVSKLGYGFKNIFVDFNKSVSCWLFIYLIIVKIGIFSSVTVWRSNTIHNRLQTNGYIGYICLCLKAMKVHPVFGCCL